MYPVVGGVIRLAKADLNFNGYAIRAGDEVFWSVASAVRSKKLYPDPERFCPFRFLHGNNDSSGSASTAKNPEPEMFGLSREGAGEVGVHSVFKRFLSEFDYKLVEGQDLSGKIPINAPKSGLRMVLSRKT